MGSYIHADFTSLSHFEVGILCTNRDLAVFKAQSDDSCLLRQMLSFKSHQTLELGKSSRAEGIGGRNEK